eukprot:TRINITY_DN39_c0_g3_i1.p1 TRINITY_DN39_c0_g3~~TRINITY_DN39_c0_g3_i1.p1  ORF type:complete len:219 (+),score=73.59 TRINITY_DN39_c0_g3_i1:96-752(+)
MSNSNPNSTSESSSSSVSSSTSSSSLSNNTSSSSSSSLSSFSAVAVSESTAIKGDLARDPSLSSSSSSALALWFKFMRDESARIKAYQVVTRAQRGFFKAVFNQMKINPKSDGQKRHFFRALDTERLSISHQFIQKLISSFNADLLKITSKSGEMYMPFTVDTILSVHELAVRRGEYSTNDIVTITADDIIAACETLVAGTDTRQLLQMMYAQFPDLA